MQEFLTELGRQAFLKYALAAGLLASLACGAIGPFVAARRITYIAGGISHSILAGLGAALWLQRARGLTWFDPLYGATLAALLSAAVIAWAGLKGSQREDTVIGSIWAVGMAVGVMFIAATPGYNQDLMGYLFGNILMVSPGQLKLLAVLDLAVLGSVVLFYNRFLAVCFDEEFARTRGIKTGVYYVMLLMLTALTVVALVSVVGIVMAIALVTLPTAVASTFTRVLWRQAVLAALLGAVFTTGGLALSYGPDLPAGATIVCLAGATYLITAWGSSLKRKPGAARNLSTACGIQTSRQEFANKEGTK